MAKFDCRDSGCEPFPGSRSAQVGVRAVEGTMERHRGRGQGCARGEEGREGQCSLAHRLDVPVQEAHRVDGLDGLQDLLAQPQGGAQREGAPRLAAAQVGQIPALGAGGRGPTSCDTNPTPSCVPPRAPPILATASASLSCSRPRPSPAPGDRKEAPGTHLQLHHHVVELLIPATADEPAHVVLPWGHRGDLPEPALPRSSSSWKLMAALVLQSPAGPALALPSALSSL